jgi:hypothetical protein
VFTEPLPSNETTEELLEAVFSLRSDPKLYIYIYRERERERERGGEGERTTP